MIKPLIKEINTKLDSFDIFSIFKDEPNIIYLDSSNNDTRLSKYSFIGINPFITIKYENNICKYNDTIVDTDIFLLLKKVIKDYSCVNNTHFPFISGGMGYFAYDLARNIEKIPEISKKLVDIPDCYFNFYDNIIIYDHLNNKTYVSAMGIIENPEETIEIIESKIKKGTKTVYNKLLKTNISFYSDFTEDTYVNAVEKMRNYIENGHIYITNMTHTFRCTLNRKPYDIYKILHKINPSPFSAYMNLESFSVLCSSPERFISIRNNIVETRPIKGTRPRGNTPEEDIKFRSELLKSEKDKSELLMIVDLERNDISKVCKPHTVKVTELFKLEEYATVYHLVSTITGELDENNTAVDCIKACFPGGSITGAPKVRAMEIIEELEPVRRNIYTGCIGYLGFDGNCDTNIVIRTILMKENSAYIGVGGGITWESNPEEEYQETLDKAKALFNSINSYED